jgi:hypothetical protein
MTSVVEMKNMMRVTMENRSMSDMAGVLDLGKSNRGARVTEWSVEVERANNLAKTL